MLFARSVTQIVFALRIILVPGGLVAGWPAAAAQAATPWHVLYTRPAVAGPTIDLRAVGDIMLGRRIAEIGATRGFDRFLADIGASGSTPLLGGDLTIGNLESPLATMTHAITDALQLVGPPEAAPALGRAGFGMLSLANNHIYDAGEPGIGTTARVLQKAGIDTLGFGATPAAARAATMKDIRGLRVAFLATSGVQGLRDPRGPPARWYRSGLDDAMIQSVKAAAARADLVVVVVHWGEEYAPEPATGQIQWAQRLVAAGADLIIGAHPHVLQPFAFVESGGRHGIVLYSLGNLLFDQLTRWDTSSGAVARIRLDRNGVTELAAAPIEQIGWRLHAISPDTSQGRRILVSLGAPASSTQVQAAHPSLTAWDWNGTRATSVTVPRTAADIVHPTSVYADLRGNGTMQLVTLSNSVLTIYAGDAATDPVVWDSRAFEWNVFRILVGDADNDGRQEVICLLIKRDRTGVLRVHPHMIGYRQGMFKLIWGGSPRPTEIRDLALADFDHDGRNEVAFIEGGTTADAPGTSISIYRWQSWFFYEEWRSPPGTYYALDSRDLDGNGTLELVADTTLHADASRLPLNRSVPAVHNRHEGGYLDGR